MLHHPTHLPIPFNSFTTTPSSSFPSSHLSATPPPPKAAATTTTREVSQVGDSKARMEHLVAPSAAIKDSFLRGSLNPLHHCQHDNNNSRGVNEDGNLEELWTSEKGDDFSIDDLLNLGGIAEESVEPMCMEDPEEEEENSYNSNGSSGVSLEEPPPTEPIVPVGDISDLEWLSHFVDDSFADIPCSAISPAYRPPAAIVVPKPEVPLQHIPNPTTHSRSPSSGSVTSITSHGATASSTSLKRTFACFSMNAFPVPAKARSKRSRTGGRVWSLRQPPLAESFCSSSASSSSSCSSTSSLSSCLVFEPQRANPDSVSFDLVVPRGRGRPPLHNKKNHQFKEEHVQKKPKKKGRKPKAVVASALQGLGGENGNGRRCSHCGVQKTPQWRTGPMGAKTLCNACGVRFKSGRLLPEYRPASSPTFLSDVHSNSHRKVLEMRRKKEQQQAEPPQFIVPGGSVAPPSPSLFMAPPATQQMVSV